MQENFEASKLDLFDNLFGNSNDFVKTHKLDPIINKLIGQTRFSATSSRINLEKILERKRELRSISKIENPSMSPPPSLIQVKNITFDATKASEKSKTTLNKGMTFLRRKRKQNFEISEQKIPITTGLYDLKIIHPKIYQKQLSDNNTNINYSRILKNQSANSSVDISDRKELQCLFKLEYKNFPPLQASQKDVSKKKIFRNRPEHCKEILNSMGPSIPSILEQRGKQNHDFSGLLLIDKTKSLSKNSSKMRTSLYDSTFNISSGINNEKFDMTLAEVQNIGENESNKRGIAKEFPIFHKDQNRHKQISPSKRINIEMPDTLLNSELVIMFD